MFGIREGLGVVSYPFGQLLFNPRHFQTVDLLRISFQLSQQTGLQVKNILSVRFLCLVLMKEYPIPLLMVTD